MPACRVGKNAFGSVMSMSSNTLSSNEPHGPLLSNVAQLKQLVAGAGDAIIACDTKGSIVLWNSAAQRIFGFTSAEALGHPLDLIIPERHRERHWEGYRKAMKSGVTKYGSDTLCVPALHKNGCTLAIAFTVCLLFDTTHNVTGIAAIVRDETCRYREECDLRARIRDLEATMRRSGDQAPEI